MHEKLKNFNATTFLEKELFISEIINFAVQDGLWVEAVHISDKPFVDIGTPEGLAEAARRFMHLSNR